MLREIRQVQQAEENRRKRWFSDPDFDLIVWEKQGGRISRFELCFGKGVAEHALAWKEETGFQHFLVDDGEGRQMRHKMAPILRANGEIDYRRVEKDFHRVAGVIDTNIADFVVTRLRRGT